MNQGILVITLRNMPQLGDGFLPLSRANQHTPFGPSDIHRVWFFGEDRVIGFNRLLGASRYRENIAAQYIQRESVRIVFNSLVEDIQSRVYLTALPRCLRTFDYVFI